MIRTYVSRVLSFGGIIAPFIVVLFIYLAGLHNPEYSHIDSTISKLSEQGSESPEFLTTGLITYGVLVIGLSYAMYLRLRHGTKALVSWFAMTLYGICMILTGIFQDIPGGMGVPLNPEGIAHNAAVIASCVSFLAGMLAFAGSVYKRPAWFGFTWFTVVAAIIGSILSIVFAVQSYIPASGLIQRLFYAVFLIWIEIVSVWLFRLTFRKE